MKSRTLVLIWLFVSMFALAACDQKGPAEELGEKIDETAENIGDAVEDACEDVTDENC